EGLIEPEESELIKSAIEFSDTEVREVMHPLSEMVAIDIKAPEAEVERVILEQKYSRLPVYAGSRERIIGVLCVKDCLPKYIRGAKVDTGRLMKLPYLISPDAKIDQVFEGLGRRRTHFAVVTDENGCATGFITMEDIMEELVGEIYDEDDVVRPARNEAAQ
ncbi:MAG: CBS domain-containing protein, partial [Oscillospiraceae bacterium]|nr:CBS domain-containing protein [Oscillospiraceae bacterium]